ncbi:protein ZNRD2-like [Asterias amurensis]|uniref:protein ZNRD2-like n=1 Tax=Asterias amurensis TaxID=7602 RepID=UPI003AB5D539
MDGEDFDWKPPSEAEMKVLQARRERSDKISKLMGDYLLKGYRMLGSCCSTCGTILLRDRQQQDYCVACSELDTDLAKDDPAVSASAAKSQVEEHELCAASAAAANQGQESKPSANSNSQEPHVTPPGKRLRNTSPTSRSSTHHHTRASRSIPTNQMACGGLTFVDSKDDVNHRYHRYENQLPGKILDLPSSSPDIVPESMEVVMGKLYWASQQLKGTTSVEASTSLCTLIKACADAMTSLRYLVPGELTD